MEQFRHISHDISIMGGKPCITGTRITVGMILMQISEGVTPDGLIKEYPNLTIDDITDALQYAAWAVGTTDSLVIPA